MSDQLVSTDQIDVSRAARTEQIKLHSGLYGSPLHPTIERLEQLGVDIPSGSGPNDLRRLLADAERKAAQTGLTKQDLLDSRGRTAWNKLAEQWAKSGVRKGRELPMHLCRTHGYSTEDCNAIDEELHSIDIDVERKANTPPWQLADDVIVGNLKRFLDAFNALEERVVALEAQRRGPPYNALVDVTPRLAVNNGD